MEWLQWSPHPQLLNVVWCGVVLCGVVCSCSCSGSWSCSCSGSWSCSCSCSVAVVVAVVVVAVVVVFHYLLPLFCGAQNFHGDQVATERKCGYFVGMHCVGDSFLSFLSILLGMESKLRKKLFNLKERPRISEENKKH